jgi:hypothetical protein
VSAEACGFLTCEPNAEVKRVHPKAMPRILTRRRNTTSGSATIGEKPTPCTPAPGRRLKIVATGEKADFASETMVFAVLKPRHDGRAIDDRAVPAQWRVRGLPALRIHHLDHPYIEAQGGWAQ